MFAVRAVWRRCAVRQALSVRSGLNGAVVPRRLMSSVPGGSGENILYVVLCGGAFAGSIVYTYQTVTSDSTRFTDRITRIEARPKHEWKPKTWPPESQAGDESSEEVEEAVAEADAEESEPVALAAEVNGEEAGPVETVVETVAETVAETAEVVAEVAAVVVEAAQEVEVVSKEVENVAEEVEAAAKALEAPVIAVEEPAAESNVAEENVEIAAASVAEKPLVTPLDDGAPVIEATSLEAEPEKSSKALMTQQPSASVVEDVLVPLPIEEPAAPVEQVPVTQNVEEALVEAAADETQVTYGTEETPVSPVAEQPTTDESPVTAQEGLSITPAEENTVAAVVEESPVTPIVEEITAAPIVEEAPISPTTEEVPAVPVAEEAPLTPSTEPAEVVVVPEAKEAPLNTESLEVVPERPIVEEVPASPSVEVLASDIEPTVESQVVLGETTPAETVGAPIDVEDPGSESKREYVVVVLEGAPKIEKKPKVLGISAMTGRIIPAPDSNEEPTGQVTGQAPSA